MRNKEARSAMSLVNSNLEKCRPIKAADVLCETYGVGALVRNINYILSRCSTPHETRVVAEKVWHGPTIPMIQLYLGYLRYNGTEPRSFSFTKDGMLKTHKETAEETAKRKSGLQDEMVEHVKKVLIDAIWKKYTHLLDKNVYVAPEMYGLAMPLYDTASQGGFGVLPSGSRLVIPEGKFVRSFVYWEKVNDIDLSCFLVSLSDQNVRDVEFSWRSRSECDKAGIVFSGDETQGYHGGSEYFDFDVDKVKTNYPKAEYAVFAATVYSLEPFKNVVCRAGFMLRDELSSGEIFEPKTVKTSFSINCDSTNAVLFAIDLNRGEMVWINNAVGSDSCIAGDIPKGFIAKYVDIADEFNVKNFFSHAAKITNDPTKADIIVSDEPIETDRDVEVIHSYDVEKLFMYLNM